MGRVLDTNPRGERDASASVHFFLLSPDFRYFVAENDEVKGETDRFIQQSAPHATKTQVPHDDDSVDAVTGQRRRRRILKFTCLAAASSLLTAGAAALVLSQRFPECSPSEKEE